ncbi:GNAT family N-acetyltransferase [uncultured Tateyamaria sp.]|uniref:GNAT family N-acetyltransferase n=1 Tax=uncultured Tateyamaria sp. TaxID=455651 RepID=UPI002610AAED|nr:GNAT family N-acetyltransferase [uncultured Tateyamaria sp.]
MEQNSVIREVHTSDFGAWRAMWAEYNAFYERSGATALSDAIVQSTWHRLLDPKEPVHGLVADVSGRLVGLAHYVFHRNTITVEDTCYLQDLFSDPAMRGQGVGRALISAFYDRAAKAGTVGVYWHTHTSNSTAMQLYDQVATHTGFVVYRHSIGQVSNGGVSDPHSAAYIPS